MAGEVQTDYDKLVPTKVFFYVALVLLVNVIIVLTYYTFLKQSPFHLVLSAEKESFAQTLSPSVQTNMRYSGDRLYSSLFVQSGVENFAYKELRNTGEHDLAGIAVMNLPVFGSIFDNLFDYFLLLCYRAGFFSITMAYSFFLILGVGIHGYVIRHRKRFGYGDTPLLLNLWARTMLAYAIPFTFFIWTLPFTVGPFALTASLAACVCGIAVFSFSLPKSA